VTRRIYAEDVKKCDVIYLPVEVLKSTKCLGFPSMEELEIKLPTIEGERELTIAAFSCRSFITK